MRYSLIHIHSDIKFLGDIQKYDDPRLSNEIIFLGESSKNLDEIFLKYKTKGYSIEKSEENISKIVYLLKEYDAIVINSLCAYKKKIILKLPKNGKPIFLRLFGFELYHKLQYKYISSKTKRSLYSLKNNQKSGFHFIKVLLKLFFSFLPLPRPSGEKKIYEKISAILLFNSEEYKELSKYFSLPEVVQLPIQHSHWKNLNVTELQKEKLIIIGNSKSYWNNHIDVLATLNSIDNVEEYTFYMFFSYGAESSYTQSIRNLISTSKNIYLQESFLNLTEFSQVYEKASALVINSYRQHALANIFTGIFTGCKIYLNEKSSTYKWLNDNGFLVFNINDLKEDVEKNNISLKTSEMDYNIQRYIRLREKYTKTDFVNTLIRKL